MIVRGTGSRRLFWLWDGENVSLLGPIHLVEFEVGLEAVCGVEKCTNAEVDGHAFVGEVKSYTHAGQHELTVQV